MTIPEILSLKYPAVFVSGFREGNFDESGTKFYAYSIFNVKGAEFEEFSSSITSYGYFQSERNSKRYEIDNGDGTCTSKDLKQLLEEEVFKFLAIQFFGIYYNEDWYIKKNWVFVGDNDQELYLKQPEMEKQVIRGEFWIAGFFANVPDENRPKHPQQFSEYKEFIGQPWLVAYEKKDIKHNLNKIFESYINEEIFIPFASALRMQLPDEFHLIQRLMHERNFPLIYPNSKQHVLGIFKAINKEGASRLYYFLYVPSDKRIFEWTLPKPQNAEGFHGCLIESDIGKLSDWKLELHDPTVTFDDHTFWSEFVFKKDGDQYRYLKPIDIKNPQPDIFTQW